MRVIRGVGERGVIGKTQTLRQPSIDELLASIRQAIHERVAPDAPGGIAAPSVQAGQGRPPSIVHARPPARPEIGPEIGAAQATMKRAVATSGREGFAGLLGGDVRLEEALARLDQSAWKSGWRHGAEAASGVEPVQAVGGAVAAPPAEPTPELRPTIEAWTNAMPAPVPDVPNGGHVDGGDGDRPSARHNAHAPDPALPGAHHAPADPCLNDELWEADPMDDRHFGAPGAAERPAPIPADAKPSELLSSQAASAASSAFNRLADAMVGRSSGVERDLDEIACELLRPLLKSWLDDNLPNLVERLVRQEIERVARPGR
jgi:hypothetical protein